jgi:hypothetical protein
MDISTEDRAALANLLESSKEESPSKITYGQVRDYLRDEHDITVTPQTVTNYHRPHDIPETINVPIVAGIMAFYGLTVSDLPDAVADAVARTTRTLVSVGGGRPDPTGPGGDESGEHGSGAIMRGCPHLPADLPVADVLGGVRAS